jgi:general secretion pathway protein G
MLMRGRQEPGDRGVSFIELMVCVAIIMVLAAAAIPLTRISVLRQKEIELKAALREMRRAIDEYKAATDGGRVIVEDLDSEGYPLELEMLVEGVEEVGQVDRKLKFLRRLPRDPFNPDGEWGLRSYQDEADSDSWGRENVFDVYSLSEGKALDGTFYKEW